MKINTKILTASLFFGMLTFGQDIDSRVQFLNNETVASTQYTDSENSLPTNITVRDTSKTKEGRDVPWFVERYKISAGYYHAFSNTNIAITNNAGTRSRDVDFEDDLGYETNTSSFLSNIEWRSTSRSRFMLTYYKINRDSSHKLERDIEFGDSDGDGDVDEDDVYHVNSEINSYFDSDFYRFSYGYAIFSKPKWEAGLSIGTHVINMKLGVRFRGDAANAEKSDDYKLVAPFPDFGIWGGYAITDRMAVNGGIDYLAISIDNIDGDILGYNLLFTYRIIKNLDLTAGFSGLNIDIEADKPRFDGHIKWGNDGFSLRASYSFGKKKWY